MTPTDDITHPLGPQDSPLTWRDQQSNSRIAASVRASLVKFDQRPSPPRGVRFTYIPSNVIPGAIAGWVLKWEAPVDSPQVTHYRVYLNDENQLAHEVPEGQHQIVGGVGGDRLFVSAINKNSGLESIKVLLDGPIYLTFTQIHLSDGVFTNHLEPSQNYITTADGLQVAMESLKSGANYINTIEVDNPKDANQFIKIIVNGTTGLSKLYGGTSSILGDYTNPWNSATARTFNVVNNLGNANTFLAITGAFDELTVSANSSGGAAGRVRLYASNAAANKAAIIELTGVDQGIRLDGVLLAVNPSLAVTGLILRDASGTTTGNSFEIQRNDGVIVFKVIGSTDSGAPGTVVTRSLVPFTDDAYVLGNATHQWNNILSGVYTVRNVSGTPSTVLNISAAFDEISIGAAGTTSSERVRMVATNTTTSAFTQIEIDNNTRVINLDGSGIWTNYSLSVTGLLLKDASGTTTGNSFELQTNGGTTFFKVIGGTDSGAPGTVVARDIVPFTTATYKLGNSTHVWATAYINSIVANGSTGVTFGPSAIATLTVSGGVVIGHT